MDDLIEREWWVFAMPHGVLAYVPAGSEAVAREVLANMCYRHAPVADWPLTGTRVACRERLTRELLRPRTTEVTPK